MFFSSGIVTDLLWMEVFRTKNYKGTYKKNENQLKVRKQKKKKKWYLQSFNLLVLKEFINKYLFSSGFYCINC